MTITNIYLRVIVGIFWIAIGLVCIKVHIDRNKDSIWGQIYRFGKDVATEETRTGFFREKIYLIIGCLLIAGGLIAIFFGFSLKMVG
jgi:hypothetical protein